jgi:RHH-type rel operon transcriptional repressor/antitoxin RelB
MNEAQPTTTFTMRVRSALKKRLESLSRSTGRSRSYLAGEAITAYLDTSEWQVSGIKSALASLDRGQGVSHQRVKKWITSWETRNERPSPGDV